MSRTSDGSHMVLTSSAEFHPSTPTTTTTGSTSEDTLLSDSSHSPTGAATYSMDRTTATSTPPATALTSTPPTTSLTSTPPTTAFTSTPPTTALTSTPPTTAFTSTPPTTALTSTPPTTASTSTSPPPDAQTFALFSLPEHVMASMLSVAFTTLDGPGRRALRLSNRAICTCVDQMVRSLTLNVPQNFPHVALCTQPKVSEEPASTSAVQVAAQQLPASHQLDFTQPEDGWGVEFTEEGAPDEYLPGSDAADYGGIPTLHGTAGTGPSTSGSASNDLSGTVPDDRPGITSNDQLGSASNDVLGSIPNNLSGSTTEDEFGSTPNNPSGSTSDDQSGSTPNNPSGSTSDDQFGISSLDHVANASNSESGSISNNQSGSTIDDQSGSTSDSQPAVASSSQAAATAAPKSTHSTPRERWAASQSLPGPQIAVDDDTARTSSCSAAAHRQDEQLCDSCMATVSKISRRFPNLKHLEVNSGEAETFVPCRMFLEVILSGWSSLRELVLKPGTQITLTEHDIQPLGDVCPQLEKLYIPAPLDAAALQHLPQALPKLNTLYFGNFWRTPPLGVLSPLSALTCLQVRAVVVATDSMHGLSTLSNLRELRLGPVYHMTPTELAPIAALPGLRCLHLWAMFGMNPDHDENGLSNPDLEGFFSKLKNLEALSLHNFPGGQADDGLFRVLGALPRLKALRINSKAKVTEASGAAAFPALTKLHVGGDKLDVKLLKGLGLGVKRKELKELVLESVGSHMADKVVKMLVQQVHLEQVSLRCSDGWSLTRLKELGCLQNLKSLNIVVSPDNMKPKAEGVDELRRSLHGVKVSVSVNPILDLVKFEDELLVQ